MKDKKAVERWSAFQAKVPGLVEAMREVQEVVTDQDIELADLKKRLPQDVVDWLDDSKRKHDPRRWSRDLAHKWILCEMPSGSYPVIREFETLDELREALAALEDTETAAVVTYGAHIPFSTPLTRMDGRKFRYLMLPNETSVVVGNGETQQLIFNDELPEDLEVQPHHWLGDPRDLEGGYYTPGSDDAGADGASA